MRSFCLGSVAAFVIAACAAGVARAEALVFPKYSIAVSSAEKGTLVLNKHLSLSLRLTALVPGAPPVTNVTFDARMPQHKHGMVTNAQVTRVSELEYKVDGVRLHMPGAWVLDFVLQHKDGETRISVPFDLSTH